MTKELWTTDHCNPKTVSILRAYVTDLKDNIEGPVGAFIVPPEVYELEPEDARRYCIKNWEADLKRLQRTVTNRNSNELVKNGGV